MVMSKILVRNMEVIKEQIRRDFKTRRRTLSCEHVSINSDKICENFLDSDIYKNCQNILATPRLALVPINKAVGFTF